MANANDRWDGWWMQDSGVDEMDEEGAGAPSLWEAEVAALSDEQLSSFEETAEDS